MTLATAAMPDDPAARARWLDEQLVGDRLGDLAAELTGLLPAAPAAALADLVGPYREDLLARGTVALPDDARQALLRHPAALLELQELVLLEGGPYWASLPRPAGLVAAAERGRAAVRAALPADEPIPLTVAPRPGWRREVVRWATLVALAVSVAVAVVAVRDADRPAAPDWGWARPGALPHTSDPKTYYHALSAAAREWYDQRPSDATSLAARMHDLRRGCSTLILTDHPPLSAEQAEDLRARCRKWAAGFDAAIAALETGRDPLAVRAEVDAIVDRLVTYLESQARSA